MSRFITRQAALRYRAQVLAESPGAFAGNSAVRKEYVARLRDLTDYQFDLAVGMLLSDASLQVSSSGFTNRLKMQQVADHIDWLTATRMELLEYTGSNCLTAVKRKNASSNAKQMYESDTLCCFPFNVLADLFIVRGRKTIKAEIKPFITEVSVANWYAGDGSKTSDKVHKGLQLHTQSFTKAECQILSEAIYENLHLENSVHLDSHSNSRYFISIAGPSFDLFIEKVGPYIHPSIRSKLPDPRADNSKYGYMTSALFDSTLGSKLVGNYVETYKRPNYRKTTC